jgi:hypothetical protein
MPLTLISDLFIGIVKCPTTFHLIFGPLASILAAIRVIKNAITVAHIVEFVALVDSAFKLLPDVV